MRDDRNLAVAAWQALGALNSGRMVPTEMSRLREMLVCASTYPMRTSYPMYSWVLSNAMLKYGDTSGPAGYIRDIFEGVLQGVGFFFRMIAADDGLSARPEWQHVPDDKSHAVVRAGERDRGIHFLRGWLRDNAEEYVIVVDPYFGPDDLELVRYIMDTDPYLKVRVLTGKRHHKDISESLVSAYAAAWRYVCDQPPPDTEVMVVGFADSGEAPFHDRWLLSKSVGLRLGTSFNSLGKKDSELSVLGGDEALRIHRTVAPYLERTKELDHRRVAYEQFDLIP